MPVFILFVFTPINQYPIDKDKVLLTESKVHMIFSFFLFLILSPFPPSYTVLKQGSKVPLSAPTQNRWTVDSGQKIGQWTKNSGQKIEQWTVRKKSDTGK